jgi:rhamnosyltransferase
LLTFEYRRGLHPHGLRVARELAVVDSDGLDVDRLLDARANQVMALLRENIALKVRGEQQRAAVSVQRRAARATNGGVLEHRELYRGRSHVGAPGAGRLVSITMPVKDGEPRLRLLLPRIFEQNVDADVELVAVDSGSRDATIELLREFDATVVEIDPADFDHGLARNLAASYARGDRLVFLSQNALPADEWWLRNLIEPLDDDPRLDGVCSRVLPRPDADVLTHKDGVRDLSAADERRVLEIDDRGRYDALSPHDRRVFVNFHTVSAALRAGTLARIPFRSVGTLGEDLLWAKEVLESGGRLQHEPTSVVFHSHDYSWEQLLRRNVDDAVATLGIFGRRLPKPEVEPLLTALVQDDWRYLEEQGLTGGELDEWRRRSVLRRTAQVVGQWVGANSDGETAELAPLLSGVALARATPAHRAVGA